MHILDKKQYQAILINSIGDNDRFKMMVERNTFKNYAGEPVGKVVKLRATLDVLETFLSVVKQDGEEFTAEEKKGLRELLTHYQSELEKVRDRKEYYRNYYKEHKDYYRNLLELVLDDYDRRRYRCAKFKGLMPPFDLLIELLEYVPADIALDALRAKSESIKPDETEVYLYAIKKFDTEETKRLRRQRRKIERAEGIAKLELGVG